MTIDWASFHPWVALIGASLIGLSWPLLSGYTSSMGRIGRHQWHGLGGC